MRLPIISYFTRAIWGLLPALCAQQSWCPHHAPHTMARATVSARLGRAPFVGTARVPVNRSDSARKDIGEGMQRRRTGSCITRPMDGLGRMINTSQMTSPSRGSKGHVSFPRTLRSRFTGQVDLPSRGSAAREREPSDKHRAPLARSTAPRLRLVPLP